MCEKLNTYWDAGLLDDLILGGADERTIIAIDCDRMSSPLDKVLVLSRSSACAEVWPSGSTMTQSKLFRETLVLMALLMVLSTSGDHTMLMRERGIPVAVSMVATISCIVVWWSMETGVLCGPGPPAMIVNGPSFLWCSSGECLSHG